jgi:hypothetical protein
MPISIGAALQNWGLIPENDGLIIFATGCSLIALLWFSYAVQKIRGLNRELRRFRQRTDIVASPRQAQPALANSPGAATLAMFSDDLSAARHGYIHLRQNDLESAGTALPSTASTEIQPAIA